ncbi:cytosolic carboxypeptidase 1 isoform X3 [Plutella xylostella]|uniref:cytosolic carboxypeptidase 1 isoform X3 n=1 Tax=Plutella xylostella TaxID=51655 RepID=UPI002032A915|nr:cytosolic carboxypeptidase 1 isoform X3 [Plutella xylostella]
MSGNGALLTVSKPTESAAASKSKQGNIDVGAENTPKSSKYKKKILSARMADDAATDCLFERLRLLHARAGDSTELARALTARIHCRLTSHDKHVRQSTLDRLWNKQTGAMQVLLAILDSSRDIPTCSSIAAILRETLCVKQTKAQQKKTTSSIPNEVQGNRKKDSKKAGKENKAPVVKRAVNPARQQCLLQLVSDGATLVLLRALMFAHYKRDGNLSNDLLTADLAWTLAILAPRDPKFALRARTAGAVRAFHLILKGHFTDNKLIFPLLVIMKQLSKNSITTAILVRDGVVGTYERVLVSLGFIPTTRLRLCLDAIDYFSKNKVCCMQIVKTGLAGVLVRVFDRWDRYEGRMKLKICAHILQTLQHLCNIRSGRRALCTKKHVATLHRFCCQCPDEAQYDTLLARVCSVVTLCLRHQALTVPGVSPAAFNLTPFIKGTNTSWPNREDEEEGNIFDTKSVISDADDDDSDIDIDGVDEFPDPDTDFGENAGKNDIAEDNDKGFGKSGDSLPNNIWNYPFDRDVEDLKKYFIFFKEFGSYNKQLRLVKTRSNSRGSILDEFLSYQASAKNTPSGLTLTMANFLENVQSEGIVGQPLHSGSGSSQKTFETSASQSSTSLKMHKDLINLSPREVYCSVASRVRSVIPFVKVAYPDLVAGQSRGTMEPLNVMDRKAARTKLLACVDRAINPEQYINEVVYDLDVLAAAHAGASDSQKSDVMLTNNDEADLNKMSPTFNSTLTFESRFESGNLRKAIQIGPREYELILMPDVNATRRHQWFYFEVRGALAGRPYVFNIVNCEKSDSQFNFGMKPVMFSVTEAVLGRPGWVRAGSDICYYRNAYHPPAQRHGSKCYLTATFDIAFPHSSDVVYLAYHFPYTYSRMMTRIWQHSQSLPPATYFRAEPLCLSLNNNEVPLLTVSAEDTPSNPIADREIVFLTSRVHPGEANASWVMDGTLSCLLGTAPVAAALRAKYVVKIVPMLNVEGVVNGCHRCGLTNEDLNRRWCKPNPILHPSIYHTKGLMEYLARVWKRPPAVYCDYHGHSRKKNVFFYGCAGAESWCHGDRLAPDEPAQYLLLPALMHRISPAFALGSCSFKVERERESTARVTVWRQLGVQRSYTMEASYCGFDRGPFKGFHLNTQHLQNVGSDFCEALNGLGDPGAGVDLQLTRDLNGNIVEINVKGAKRNRQVYTNWKKWASLK